MGRFKITCVVGRDEDPIKGVDRMFRKKKICRNCKTGEENYIIDPGAPACPYISCYNGESCAYYIPLEEQNKRECFLKKLFQNKR